LSEDQIGNLLKTRGVHPAAHVDVTDLGEAQTGKAPRKPGQFQTYGFYLEQIGFHQKSISHAADRQKEYIQRRDTHQFQEVATREDFLFPHELRTADLIALRCLTETVFV